MQAVTSSSDHLRAFVFASLAAAAGLALGCDAGSASEPTEETTAPATNGALERSAPGVSLLSAQPPSETAGVQATCSGYYHYRTPWCTWDGALRREAHDFCTRLGRQWAHIYRFVDYCGADETGSNLYKGVVFTCCVV